MTELIQRIYENNMKEGVVPNTSEWLEKRKKLLSGSKIGAILGKSKFTSKRQVFLNMISKDTSTPSSSSSSSKIMQHGIDTENLVDFIYCEKTQSETKPMNLMIHREYPFIGATPDRINIGKGRLVEYKSVVNREIDTETIPEEYSIQCQIQMEVTDMEMCDFVEAKLIRVNEYEAKQYAENVGGIKEWINFTNSPTPTCNVKIFKDLYYNLQNNAVYVLERFVVHPTLIRDREWFKSVLPELKDFYDKVTQVSCDYIENGEDEIEIIDDTPSNSSSVSATGIVGSVFNTLTFGVFKRTKVTTTYEDACVVEENQESFIKENNEEENQNENEKKLRIMQALNIEYDYENDFMDIVEIRNVFNDDPFLSWCKFLQSHSLIKDGVTQSSSSTFLSIFKNKEKQYHQLIERLISSKAQENNFTLKLIRPPHLLTDDVFKQTSQAIFNDNVDIIINPYFVNHTTKRYGTCSALMKVKVFSKLLSRVPVALTVLNQDKYIPVSFKYASLSLKTNHFIYNNGSIPYYKAHLSLICDFLNDLKVDALGMGVIIARKYKMGDNTWNGWFDMVGLCDFKSPTTTTTAISTSESKRKRKAVDVDVETAAGLDFDIISKAKNCFEVLKDISVSGMKWYHYYKHSPSLLLVNDTIDLEEGVPLPLYYHPNMSNTQDAPFKILKQAFAEYLGEMTMVSHITPQHRIEGVSLFTPSFDLPTITQNMGPVITKYVSAILSAQRSSNGVVGKANAFPKEIKTDSVLPFIFDIEIINSLLMENFESSPTSSEEERIVCVSLIPVVTSFPLWKSSTVQTFTIESESIESEVKLIKDVYAFIRKECEHRNKTIDDAVLVHWGSLDASTFQNRLDAHTENENIKDNEYKKMLETHRFNFLDLLPIIKNNSKPIGVKGCFTYNLSDLANALYEQRKIEKTWMDEEECKFENGLEASSVALCYLKNSTDDRWKGRFENVKKYNANDVWMLREVFKFFYN
jgi:putative phage-type endonuclease